MNPYFYTPTNNKSGVCKTLTNEDCLKFYLRHYRNVVLLERIKTLQKDFYSSKGVEEEIEIGRKKCEYFYKRLEVQGALLSKKTSDIKVAMSKVDISVFL